MKLKENIVYLNYFFLSITIVPICVLAPIGTWGPILMSSIILLPVLLKDLFKHKYNKITYFMFILLIYILLNNFFIGYASFLDLIKLPAIVLCSMLILISTKYVTDYKKIVTTISYFLIFFSCFIIIDYSLVLGLKLWLSLNFDKENFDTYFVFKNWISIWSFKENYTNYILKYLDNTYDKGIISLSLISIPVISICILYDKKYLAFLTFFISNIPILTQYNLSILFVNTIVFFFALLIFFSKLMFRKTIIILVALNCFIFPFLIVNLDYKKFSDYEKEIEIRQIQLINKYPLLCIESKCQQYKSANKEWKKYATPQVIITGLLYSEISISKLVDSLSFYKNYYLGKILHRLIIWSYVKEKILQKPLLGHGLFASKYLGEKVNVVDINNKIISIIPLHPHNGLLQIWLELGLIGICIFFFILFYIIEAIYSYSKKNFNYAALSLISFLQVFLISQLSFGIWQIWWLALIIYIIYLNRIIFNHIESSNNKNKSYIS